MADTILSGKLTVYYSDDNNRKQIRWTGTAAKSDVQKMIDIYDASEDLFTIPTQQDDGLIFSAETPSEYTIGKIDAGDEVPWFIDLVTMEHVIGDYANFTGCALKTNGWKRVTDSNNGIVVVPVSSGGSIVTGDIGQSISHADGDSGVLLDVIITGGSTDYLWIRPTNDTSTHDWDSTSGTITEAGTSHTATQSAASVTGEMVWGNVYTKGALLADTHVVIFQNGNKITRQTVSTDDYWEDGQVDRPVPITDWTTDNFPIIDEGYLTVKTAQYTTKYSFDVIRMNTTTGGAVSAGIASGDPGNNTTGYASVTLTGATGNYNVGDEVEGQTSGARAILTKVDNPGATPTLHFYYVGDPLTAFSTSEDIDNNDDTGQGTENGSGVANQGPALTTWFDNNTVPTLTFANNQIDIDDNGTDEEYGITIDLNQCSLAQMHEYLKYITRRGSTFDLDGVDGEQWIGLDYAINYSTINGTVSEGSTVTGVTSGATGTVVSNPGGSSNTALLRNSRGTFVDGEQIQVDGSNYFAASGLTVEVITPVAESSFGTLAGTNFFGSRGVVLDDYKTTEQNLFSVIDATGVTNERPTAISVTITNCKQYDYITGWRLTGSGGSVNKTEYSAVGGEVAGDTTIDCGSSIAADVPGKTVGGTLVLVDNSDNNQEYVIRFSSYNATTAVVTLANVDIAALTGGDTNTLNETGAFTNTKVGDLVYNHDLDEVSYVSVVTSNDSVEINPPFTADPTGDHVELNCVPVTVEATNDKIYFSIIWEFKESDGNASASMQYVGDFYMLLRARNTSSATTKIKGYSGEVAVTSAGGAGSVTRIPNTVYGS